MGALQPWHWIILLLVVVVLFGSKRLPDAARSLGKSMRIFKTEVKELQADNKADVPITPVQPTVQPPAQAAPAQVHSERVEAPAPNPTDNRPA
jgi:sec-independent protein translocase protein TatA